MAANRRSSWRRAVLFDDLESRAMLGVVSPAIELRSPHQAVLRGTIRGQITPLPDPTLPAVVDFEYVGRGIAGTLGRVTYVGHDKFPTAIFVSIAENGLATLTTSNGGTLAVKYAGPGRSISPGVQAYKLSGVVLGKMSTGQFAQSSGSFSGQNFVNYIDRTFKLTFSIKPS
jgi:hypothetical protein